MKRMRGCTDLIRLSDIGCDIRAKRPALEQDALQWESYTIKWCSVKN